MNKELQNKVNDLAEQAKASGDNNAAIVLFTLSGAMLAGLDGPLATECQEHSKRMIVVMKDLRSAELN